MVDITISASGSADIYAEAAGMGRITVPGQVTLVADSIGYSLGPRFSAQWVIALGGMSLLTGPICSGIAQRAAVLAGPSSE